MFIHQASRVDSNKQYKSLYHSVQCTDDFFHWQGTFNHKCKNVPNRIETLKCKKNVRRMTWKRFYIYAFSQTCTPEVISKACLPLLNSSPPPDCDITKTHLAHPETSPTRMVSLPLIVLQCYRSTTERQRILRKSEVLRWQPVDQISNLWLTCVPFKWLSKYRVVIRQDFASAVVWTLSGIYTVNRF